MSQKREPGYYWVKFKSDTATAGDMDVIMGLCFPGPDKWVIGKFGGDTLGGWEVDGYDISYGYFSEINETRIPAPDEKLIYKIQTPILNRESKINPFTDTALGEPWKSEFTIAPVPPPTSLD